MLYSPLEQFEISTIIPFRLGSFDISFTNSSFFMLLVCAFISIILLSTTFNSQLVPTRWQSLGEMLYEFVYGIVIENLGKSGQKYFPLLFVLFSFILFSNLIGMIPYSFTITSHVIVTFCLAFSLVLGLTLMGLIKHKFHFFSLFFPSGAPLALAPLIVPIEIISYLSRPVSLSIRLGANMMSGHSLLKIIAGFAWTMLFSGGILAIASFVPLAFLVVFIGLEFCIAFLQAYVFTVLISLYINDAINLH